MMRRVATCALAAMIAGMAAAERDERPAAAFVAAPVVLGEVEPVAPVVVAVPHYEALERMALVAVATGDYAALESAVAAIVSAGYIGVLESIAEAIASTGDVEAMQRMLAVIIHAKDMQALKTVVGVAATSRWELIKGAALSASHLWALAVRGRIMELRGEDTTAIWAEIERIGAALEERRE